ncbi:unnamed protein product [Moneuplotes crassus]|uniref:Uncharacterized protein n=1 Tax=Euplotes crassus TaxID=5936 RepID=A0AAD1UC61_EUPCR|nr:unnamed protein product [Moneuplotes crassus]
MSHIDDNACFDTDQENFETEMSEKVEDDYYSGFLKHNLGQCVAHSKYHRICRFFITSNTFSSSGTIDESMNEINQGWPNKGNNDTESDKIIFCTPRLAFMQQTQTVKPKDKMLAKLDSPNVNTVPKKYRKLENNAQKSKVAENYGEFKHCSKKSQKTKRSKNKHSFTVKISSLTEEETDTHITDRCPDSLKEMQKKLRKRSNNLDKLMQKHRRINSIHCKSYKSRKGTLYLNNIIPKKKTLKLRAQRDIFIKQKMESHLKKHRSGSKTPKVPLPLQLDQNLKRAGNRGSQSSLNSSIVNFQKAGLYLKKCSSSANTNKTAQTRETQKTSSDGCRSQMYMKSLDFYKSDYKFINSHATGVLHLDSANNGPNGYNYCA